MEIDYIESLRKQKEDAWEAFDKAREDYNNAIESFNQPNAVITRNRLNHMEQEV